MSRDMRVAHNWALLHAQNRAAEHKKPLHVVFALRKDLKNYAGTRRLLEALLTGLQEVERNLQKLHISFSVLLGEPVEQVQQYVKQHNITTLITDFSPIRPYAEWHSQIAQLPIQVQQVDAHNVIPCWHLSDKQEYAAYTIRPKVHKKLIEFLEPYPPVQPQPTEHNQLESVNWNTTNSQVSVDEKIEMPDWFKPGTTAGYKQLQSFIDNNLDVYDEQRNDPNARALSHLSPWLHFGHISAQQVALEIQHATTDKDNKAAFIEELIVRRELSDNYCFYNKNYDSPEGYPDWAKKTLSEHADDKREYLYSHEQLENSQTHDPLWNAAQTQMVKTGKMHGYLRMYWAKKILEWTENVAQAHKTALQLNDTYELDGRDPNGYTGVAWSLGGVHDRAWTERPIFGKIRYMNYNGAKRKFDVKVFEHKWLTGEENSLFE